MTAPSGAQLVRVEMTAPRPGQSDAFELWAVSTVLPAGPLTEAALAWEMRDLGSVGDDPPVRHIGVLGPVGATSAELIDGVKQSPPVALTDRAGLLPPPGEGAKRVQVQFRDGTGRLLDLVDVLDLHAELPTGLPE